MDVGLYSGSGVDLDYKNTVLCLVVLSRMADVWVLALRT